jgi:hypothetical protein
MSFTIHNLEGQPLGFLLMTDKESFGECIFRFFPKKSLTSETKDSAMLRRLQAIGKLKYIILNGLIIIRHTGISESIIIENNLFAVDEQQYQLVELNNA